MMFLSFIYRMNSIHSEPERALGLTKISRKTCVELLFSEFIETKAVGITIRTIPIF